ncbi:4-oxalocrotonate tautomerase family protein [Candidatus Bipolaricaulota bacterium]
MPILDIEAVLFDHETIDSNWAREIADAAGRIFDTPPGRTWVRVRGLPRSHYAENGADDSPQLCPVFVSVLKAQLPDVEDLRTEVDKLTGAIARIIGHPEENVHVL